ncbi:MAG: DUF2977 domain-containing protein [Lachnospiraceae bacterium]|nr:DUF2977 domain-containing protein [Lachnospiraceae bacterium]
MKVQINESGFVTSYALVGDILGSTEAPEPEDLEHFESHFEAYRLTDDGLVFCPDEDESISLSKQKNDLRIQREKECFSVINRGMLWYETLTDEQAAELTSWYKAWLDVTDTLTVPESPAFIK